jgi:predicted ATPase
MMFRHDVRSYRQAERREGRVFFDRGVVDVIGYLRLVGLSIPKHIQEAVEAFRYNRSAFVAPPWKEICEKDTNGSRISLKRCGRTKQC